mgnify:CR=1 FL=1
MMPALGARTCTVGGHHGRGLLAASSLSPSFLLLHFLYLFSSRYQLLLLFFFFSSSFSFSLFSFFFFFFIHCLWSRRPAEAQNPALQSLRPAQTAMVAGSAALRARARGTYRRRAVPPAPPVLSCCCCCCGRRCLAGRSLDYGQRCFFCFFFFFFFFFLLLLLASHR